MLIFGLVQETFLNNWNLEQNMNNGQRQATHIPLLPTDPSQQTCIHLQLTIPPQAPLRATAIYQPISGRQTIEIDN